MMRPQSLTRCCREGTMVTPIIHVYAQEREHRDALIVANLASRGSLLARIKQALEADQAQCEVFVADGEGYNLKVILDANDCQSKSWSERPLPYTDRFLNRGTHS